MQGLLTGKLWENLASLFLMLGILNGSAGGSANLFLSRSVWVQKGDFKLKKGENGADSESWSPNASKSMGPFNPVGRSPGAPWGIKPAEPMSRRHRTPPLHPHRWTPSLGALSRRPDGSHDQSAFKNRQKIFTTQPLVVPDSWTVNIT